MKAWFGLFFIVFALLIVRAYADPPLHVLASESHTTHFKWQWPYEPVSTYTSGQTKPYHTMGRIVYLTHEDLTKYRFHYRQNVYTNEWGYYFPPGTKLSSRRPIQSFDAPTYWIGYTQQK